MTKAKRWTPALLKLFRTHLDKILAAHPEQQRCLLQLALLDKFLQDMKDNFYEMQALR
jgi:hypothetical protein